MEIFPWAANPVSFSIPRSMRKTFIRALIRLFDIRCCPGRAISMSILAPILGQVELNTKIPSTLISRTVPLPELLFALLSFQLKRAGTPIL